MPAWGRRQRDMQLFRRGAHAVRVTGRAPAGRAERGQPFAMRFTVAVCTWNRAALLPGALERLARVRPPPGAWEVLVVDNNSTDDTESVLEAFAGRLPLRRAFEPEQGLSHARNTAVRLARGDYIVWTDDDALVDADWLTAYGRAVEQHPDAHESRNSFRTTRRSARSWQAAPSARRRPSSAPSWLRAGQAGGCPTRRSSTGFRKSDRLSNTCAATTPFRVRPFTSGTGTAERRFWGAPSGSGAESCGRSWPTRAPA